MTAASADEIRPPTEVPIPEGDVKPTELSLAKQLIAQTSNENFEPAVSHSLKLDHGTFVPVRYTLPDFDLPLIPTFQNCVQPPLPSLRRAAAFGAAIRQAWAQFPLPAQHEKVLGKLTPLHPLLN